MNSKKLNLASSTPNRAVLNSNRAPEWNYDSVFDSTTEGIVPVVVDETYIVREKSQTAVSASSDANSAKSREGANKTVTPQNEVEIQPEKIKKIRLSFNKPQSRLMNTSSFVAKDPSLPLDKDESSDGDQSSDAEQTNSRPRQKSGEATRSSLRSSTPSTLAQTSSSVANNANNTKKMPSVLIDNSSAFYDKSAVSGTKRKKTIRVVIVKPENTLSLSNGDSTEEELVSDAPVSAAELATASTICVDEHEEDAEPGSSPRPSTFLNHTADKSNVVANKTQTNGSIAFSLTNQLDSDSETPINRKSVSNSSANPTESFKKKLFSDYFEENSEHSYSLKKFEKYKRKLWVRVKPVNLADIFKPAVSETYSGTPEVEPKSKRAKLESGGNKSGSLSRRGLVHLENSGSSNASKKKYLADWVENQNSLLNESFEVELNRRFKAVSRSTQTSDLENSSEASSTTASYVARAKRGTKKTKTLAPERASKRKSNRESLNENGVKRVNYKESSISTSTEMNARGRSRRETKKPLSNDSARSVDGGDDRDDRDDDDDGDKVGSKQKRGRRGLEHAPVTKRVTRARNTKATVSYKVDTDSNSNTNPATSTAVSEEKQGKKAPVTRKRAAKSSKTEQKESDSDDIPLIEISKKKSTKEKAKPPEPARKTRANAKSKKATEVDAVARETENPEMITISESESNLSEKESVVTKTGKKAGTRVLPRRNARNKEAAATKTKETVAARTRETRTRSGAAAKKAANK